MPLVTTPGGPSADSYVSVAEADAYFSARVGSTSWTALSGPDKETALRHATRNLDLLRFRGWPVTEAQALRFPRWRPDRGEAPVLTIPREVQDACCEEALWVSQHAEAGGLSPRQQMQAEGVSSFTVGDLSETFASGGSGAVLCPRASALLRHWIARGGQLVDTGRERPNYDGLPSINR